MLKNKIVEEGNNYEKLSSELIIKNETISNLNNEISNIKTHNAELDKEKV